MLLDWGARLFTLLALFIILAGLIVLALPDAEEGPIVVQLDPSHSLRVADFVGAGLIGIGMIIIWTSVLAWQRKRIS